MNFTYITACVALAMAVGGCATRFAPVGPFDVAQLSAARPIEHSVLRVGDEVSFAVQQGGVAANYTVACDKPQAWLLYSHAKTRRYPSGAGLFSPRQMVNQDIALRLKAMPGVASACGGKADWREVRRDNTGTVAAIDVNSIEKIGSDLRFWAMLDYGRVALDPPYQAPYGQKFERFHLSCAKQRFTNTAGFDVDEKGRVTDGIVFGTLMPAESIGPETNDDYKALFKTACGDAAQMSRLPAFVTRDKRRDDPSTVRAPDPKALEAIAQLKLPAAKKQLTRLVTSGPSTFEGKTKQIREEYDFSPYPAAGIANVKSQGFGPTGPSYSGKSVNFLGLFDLSSQTQYSSRSSGNAMATDVVFTGEWARMEPGDELVYDHTSNNIDTGSSWTHRYVHRCKVIERVAASTLHPDLAGQAKRLECRTDDDQYKRVDTRYFLEDYAYFLNTDTSKNPFYYSSSKIIEVGQR